MRAIRALWRFLTHPILAVAGNVSLLLAAAPIAIAVVAAVVGWVLDQPVLFLIAIGLAGLGLILVGVVAVRSTQGSSALSTAGAQSDETRLRSPAFIAVEGELALASEEALEMAKTLRAEWPHITPDGALVQTVLPDWRAKTTDFIAEVLGSAQRAAFKGAATGNDVLERLEAERKFLSVLALNLSTDAIRLNEAGVLNARAHRRDNESAGLLNYDHHRAPGAPPPDDLAERLDSVMREGIHLVDEFSAPVEPQKTEGGWKLEGGDAPASWWAKADAFTQSIRSLLIERHPALLADFRDGFNGYLQQERDVQRSRNADSAKDKRSTAEKMRDLANFERSGPARVVEASLEGLAVARKAI